MTWVRLSEDICGNAKLRAAGPAAKALYIAAICHANKHLTDGFIADYEILPLAATEGIREADVADTVAALLEVRARISDNPLWRRVEGGYEIHDYHEYQPTRAAELAKRKKRAVSGALGGAAKAANQRALDDQEQLDLGDVFEEQSAAQEQAADVSRAHNVPSRPDTTGLTPDQLRIHHRIAARAQSAIASSSSAVANDVAKPLAKCLAKTVARYPDSGVRSPESLPLAVRESHSPPETLNVARSVMKTSLSRLARSAIDKCVEVTSQAESRARVEQIYGICDREHVLERCWDSAMTIVINKLEKDRDNLARPGAYWDKVITALCREEGVIIPVGDGKTRRRVRDDIRASLAAADTPAEGVGLFHSRGGTPAELSIGARVAH